MSEDYRGKTFMLDGNRIYIVLSLSECLFLSTGMTYIMEPKQIKEAGGWAVDCEMIIGYTPTEYFT